MGIFLEGDSEMTKNDKGVEDLEHAGVFCRGCNDGTKSIFGIRFKCLDCMVDFSLCEECYITRKSIEHSSTHNFQCFTRSNQKHGFDFKNQRHDGITCCLCAKTIYGLRYRCITCQKYNLCENCVFRGKVEHQKKSKNGKKIHNFETLAMPIIEKYDLSCQFPLDCLGIILEFISVGYIINNIRGSSKTFQKFVDEQYPSSVKNTKFMFYNDHYLQKTKNLKFVHILEINNNTKVTKLNSSSLLTMGKFPNLIELIIKTTPNEKDHRFLTEEIFQNVQPNLEKIILDNPNQEFLIKGKMFFTNLKNLKDVEIDFSHSSNSSNRIFSLNQLKESNHSLERLFLTCLYLHDMNTFGLFKKLKFLMVKGCGIQTSVAKGVFINLTELQELFLSNQGGFSYSVMELGGLLKLKKLTIKRCFDIRVLSKIKVFDESKVDVQYTPARILRGRVSHRFKGKM